MLEFTEYSVKTNAQDMCVRRVGTNVCGSAMSRRAGDSEDDYEEITAEQAAEIQAQAEAEAEAQAAIKAEQQAKQQRDAAIVAKVRERYTLDEELAILRQRDVKADEFESYYEYVEQCKAEVNSAVVAELTSENIDNGNTE